MSESTKPVQLLIDFLDQAFEKSAWHGTTLKGSVRHVDHELAVWRPDSGQHNIREIIIHTAYWKYTIWKKLVGKTDVTFDYRGTDWQKLPHKLDARLWLTEKAIIKKHHKLLISELEKFPAGKLLKIPPKSKFVYKRYLLGVGSHDLYHAGQIQLIKRLKKGGKAGT